MESYLEENFGVKREHSATEVLERWRNLCGVVKNPKRRFRFTAKLSERYDAAANQEKLQIAVQISEAAIPFLFGESPGDYTVPEEVKAAGFQLCAGELGSIVERHDVEKLKFHGGVSGVAEKLSTSLSDGLTTDPDLFNRRQEIYGINEFAKRKARSFWALFWEDLLDMNRMTFWVCAFVSLIVGLAIEGWPHGAYRGIGIVASMLLVVFVTATSDYRQPLQFKKITIKVTRNGFQKELSTNNLLPGDIVHLRTGDQVPADGLFVSGFSVSIDGSSLTRKSKPPVIVNAENPFMLSGTKLQDGSCKMMVTTVGIRTQWGKLMATLGDEGDDETPLRVKLNGVVTLIGKGCLFLAVVAVAVLVQGLFSRKLGEGTIWSWSGYEALKMLHFFVAATVVVLTVQEIYGINRFAGSKARKFWDFVWKDLKDMTLMLVGFCAFVFLIVGLEIEGWLIGAHDGLGIVASMLLVEFFTATSDYCSSFQFRDPDNEKKKLAIQISTPLTLDKVLPSTKVTASIVGDYNSCKLEVQYDQDTFTTTVALNQCHSIDITATIRTQSIAFGIEACYNITSGSFTKYTAEIAVTLPDWCASTTLGEGRPDDASYLLKGHTAAEIYRSFSTNSNNFTVEAGVVCCCSTTKESLGSCCIEKKAYIGCTIYA